MEEKHKPNSHKRLRRRRSTLNSWSDLPLDLLNSVFERLSFEDFQRAKSVCSSWQSVSRQYVSRNKQIHWLILFPKYNDKNDNYSCRLFNPEEKDKLYRTQDLGLEFARSVCMKTYGNWLLMRDPLCNLYIVNLCFQERINLPPTELQLGKTTMKRIKDGVFRFTSLNGRLPIRSPVFSVDEKTKDHIVLWVLGRCCVVYSRKGDNSWNQIPETSGCCDMVYKDLKLYFLSYSGRFKIFDFSGEIPQQTFHCGGMMSRCRFSRKSINHESWVGFRVLATKLVVTVTGEVLMVEKCLKSSSKERFFQVFKVYSSGFHDKHKLISLGDEAMLLDQGITVPANDTDGFIRNSIYFSVSSSEEKTKEILLFNLETQKTEPPHEFDCSSVLFSRARWFLPSFT